MRLDWKKVLLSCCITALILFGGWFAYHYVNTDKPIYSWFDDPQLGVQLLQLNTTQSETQVLVRFHDGDRFYQTYRQLSQFLEDQGRRYHIEIDPMQGEFHPFWKDHSALFMEAWQSGNYTEMKDYIDQLERDHVVKEGYMIITRDGLFLYLDPVDREQLYMHFPMTAWKGDIANES